jgi:RNA polymerase sigma-70 factor (ECF subfamily)
VPKLIGWVKVVVYNFIFERKESHDAQMRRAAREAPGSKLFALLAASGSSPEQRAIRHEEAVRVANAIGRLHDRRREVVQKRYFDGLTYAEIARLMQITLVNVRVLCFRALEDLRRIMETSK